MIRTCCLSLVLMLCITTGRAEPYWVAYEGNDFPENGGWVRHTTGPPPERWLEEGTLLVDSRVGPYTTDTYTVFFDGGLDPGPGETFLMQWKLNIHEATPWEDPGVYVVAEDHWSVLFAFGEGYLTSTYESNVYAEFEAGAFHEFEMRSTDMRQYTLYIDGDPVVHGMFVEGLQPSYVGWGDVTGGGSLTAWDYFRFGVVPEPACASLLSFALVARRILT